MKMKRYAVICYVLLIALLLSFSSMAIVPADPQYVSPDYVEKYIDPNEESYLTLSYDYEFGEVLNIKVTDERTGKVWESNPIFTVGDKGSNEERTKLLKSQLMVKYAYDKNTANVGSANYMADLRTETTVYSFEDSVEKDQLDIIETFDESGNLVKLRVEYGFGNVEDIPVPKVLTKERLDYWLEQCFKRDDEGNIVVDDAGNPVIDTRLQDTLFNYYEEISIAEKLKDYERELRRIKDDKEREARAKEQEKELERFLSDYPGLKLQDGEQILYKVYDTTLMNIRSQREAMATWASIGYNKDELEKDYNLAMHTEITTGFAFVVPVEYELQGNDLVASIISDEILYPNGVVLVEIHLLPSFGAGDDTTEDAYTFLPDGSGAVVIHNKSESRITSTIISLLGFAKDEANNSNIVTEVPYYETSVLPVFGQKQDDNAFVAVIEKGFEVAGIFANSSDNLSKFHLSYPIFYPTVRDTVTTHTGAATPGQSNLNGVVRYPRVNTIEIGEYRDGNLLRMMSNIQVKSYARIPATDLSVRYSFLSGEDASYVGMAKFYRNYLIDTYKLDKIEAKDDIPLYTDIYGAIDKMVSYVGFPFNVKYALTTFKQAGEIVDAIQALDISNIKMRYLYMANGGAVSTAANKFNVMGKLGGEKGFKTFLKNMNAEGVTVYPEIDLIHVFDDKLFDGFSPNKHAVQTLGKTQSIIYDKDLATGINPLGAFEYFHPRWAISTNYYEKFAAEFFKDYEKYDNKYISIGSYGNTLNSDYYEKKTIDRTQTSRVMVELLAKYKEEGYDIIVEKGYSHVLPYVDTVLNIAMGSSKLVYTDYEVPFLQMVLHGLVEYAGEPINVNQDYSTNVLKCLEYGSTVYVRLMYQENDVFQNTYFQNLYSMDYRAWLETIDTMYDEVNAVLGQVQDQFIVDHERLDYNVYRTTYENGLQVIVNYNLEDYVDAVSGRTVAAQGYIVIGGEQ